MGDERSRSDLHAEVHVVARVLGAFVIRTGEAIETKLLCVSERDHHQNHLRELDDLPTNASDELDARFAAYRMLEPGTCEVVDHLGRDEVVREWLNGHPPADPHRTNGQL